MQEPGKIIKSIAKSKNIKLSDIANETGMIYQTLSIKISKSKFTIKELDEIAEALYCILEIQIINPETKVIKECSNISASILEILKEKKLHQVDLARSIGTSRQNISKFFKSDPCKLQIQQIISFINALEYSLKISFIDKEQQQVHVIYDIAPMYTKQLDYLKELLENSSLNAEETNLILSNFKTYIERERG